MKGLELMSQELYILAGLLLTFIGLVYTAEQIRHARKVSLADFLLKLDDQVRNYDEVHSKLRPGGEWSKRGTGPQTTKEWIPVEKYMGLFERIQLMVESGIVPLVTIKKFYGYRVANIVSNEVIKRKKLEDRKEYWKDFIKLAKSLNVYK